MESKNVLNIDYLDGLRFKHLDGVTYVVDFELPISEGSSLTVLEEIRNCMRNDQEHHIVYADGYEIYIKQHKCKELELMVSEIRGDMSRPIGTFIYNRFMGDISLLTGLTSSISKIRDDM